MNNTHQAVEAAVQQIMTLAKDYANAVVNKERGGNTHTGAVVLNEAKTALEAALRAALTSQQEVAAPVGECEICHGDAALCDAHDCGDAHSAASRVPVASGASKLQRYSFAFDGAEMPIAVPHSAGNWVKYEDVATPATAPAAPVSVAGDSERWEIVRETVVSDVPGSRPILTHAKPYAPEWPDFDSFDAAHAFHASKDLPLGWVIKRVAAPVHLDEARYQWLRNSSVGQWEHPIAVTQQRTPMGMRYVGPLTGKALDKAVDAAILASKAGTAAGVGG